MSRATEPQLAAAYRDLEGDVCDVHDMLRLVFLAHEDTGAVTPSLVLFGLNQLEDMTKRLRQRYYAGYGEAAP